VRMTSFLTLLISISIAAGKSLRYSIIREELPLVSHSSPLSVLDSIKFGTPKLKKVSLRITKDKGAIVPVAANIQNKDGNSNRGATFSLFGK